MSYICILLKHPASSSTVLKRGLTSSNSEFSFNETDSCTKVKEPSQHYLLFTYGCRRIYEFLGRISAMCIQPRLGFVIG